MRFGLLRSLIFWSGLLTVVFLAWGTRDSREWCSSVELGPCRLMSVCGGLLLERDPTQSASFSVQREPAPRLREALEGPFLLQGRGGLMPYDWSIEDWWDFRDYCDFLMGFQARGSWVIFIPYWLLLMATGMLWWALLVWRQRRGIDWGREK